MLNNHYNRRLLDKYHCDEIRGMAMALALFDLDNTLINGDSDHAWGLYLAEIGVVNAKQHEAAQDRFYQEYVDGTLDINEFLEFQLTPLKEHSLNELLAWRADFIEKKIKPLIHEDKVTLVQKHRDSGDSLVIITATNSFITSPIADLFGIETLIATEPEQNSDGFTGKVLGTPCFQAGKITKLNEWLTNSSETMKESWFYSDSYNDLPLLLEVDHPVCVSPDTKLSNHAKANDWPII